MNNQDKKELLKNILAKYKPELLANNFQKIFDQVSENRENSGLLVDILEEVGIDYMSGLTHIPPSMFANSENIKSIQLPNTITSIGEGAFEDCPNLEEVIFPMNYAEAIPARCMQGCEKLKNIFIPKTCKGLERYAIDGCPELATVVIQKRPKDDPTLSRSFECPKYLEEILKKVLVKIDSNEQDFRKYFK